DFRECDGRGHDCRNYDDRPRTLGVVHAESQKAPWWLNRLLDRERIEQVFEPAIHRISRLFVAAARSDRRAPRATLQTAGEFFRLGLLCHFLPPGQRGSRKMGPRRGRTKDVTESW